MKKITLIINVLVILLFSCQFVPKDELTAAYEKGSLALTISTSLPRTILPDTDMEVSSYDLIGVGPENASFEVLNIGGGTVVVEDLVPGSWSVGVTGKNSQGIVIVSGDSTVIISPNQASEASVEITPVEGEGTALLSISWPESIIMDPGINAELIPVGETTGFSADFLIAPDSLSASYSNSTLQEGYYVLNIQLLDSSETVWGITETVRIVTGQTTTGVFVLTANEINEIETGSFSINITVNEQSPVQIVLSGVENTIPGGTDMEVTADTVPLAETFQWKLNGQVLEGEIESTISLGSGLEAGKTYRLDVVASNGDTVGSEGFYFTIEETLPLNSWSYMGGRGMSYYDSGSFISSLASDSTSMYAAYAEGTASIEHGGKLSVLKYNTEEVNGSWEIVGSEDFSSGHVIWTDMVIDNGIIYNAYIDNGLGNSLVVKYFDGTEWENVENGVESVSGGEASEPAIAVLDGRIAVAYRDGTKSNKITVKEYAGSTWTLLGTEGFTSGVDTYSPDVEIYNNTVYLSVTERYTHYGVYSIVCQKYNEAAEEWESVGDNAIIGKGNFSSLTIYNGNPAVIYADFYADYKASVRAFNASANSWDYLGPKGYSGLKVSYGNNRPAIKVIGSTIYTSLYRENFYLSVMKYNGSSWEFVGAPDITRCDYSTFSYYGTTPVISYRDTGAPNSAGGFGISVQRYVE